MTTDNDSSGKPRKRFTSTASKIIGVHIILILVAIVFFIAHENRQAERDWNEFNTHWEAKGEIFDLEKFIPPEIPDEENFAAAPIIAELFDASNEPRLSGLDLHKIPGLVEYSKYGDNPDQYLGGPNMKFTDYFKKLDSFSNEAEAAKVILEKLSAVAPLFDELEQASLRPKARFPLDYDELIFLALYHISPLERANQALNLRALCRLSSGDSAGATRDLLTLTRIAKLIGSEPCLISNMVEGSCYKKLLKPLWEGMRSNQFNTKELGILQKALQNQGYKSRFTYGLRCNRSLLFPIDEKTLSEYYNWSPRRGAAMRILYVFKAFGLSNAFWYRNKLNYSRFVQDYFLTSKGEIHHGWVDLDVVSGATPGLLKLKASSLFNENPYTLFVSHYASGLENAAQQTAQTATRIDLARIAIALELYRREHGKYPITLTSLAPKYIDVVPLDIINGVSLHYRIKADGTPLIYSVGLNKIDDGGQPRRKLTSGDWIWQYTLPDNFDEIDWRK